MHELERYSQTLQLDTDDNPLLWWKGNQQMFSLLALMAKKFLNQAHASHRPACTWFLKIDPERIIGMRVCVRPEAINN